MRCIINHPVKYFSRYHKFDKTVQQVTQKKVVPTSEPTIALKPKSLSFYNANNSIQPFEFPNYNITTPHEIPMFMHNKVEEQIFPKIKNQPDFPKRLKVAIWGPTNSGKSELFNKLVGKEISAVSNKSFTTDSPIIGLKSNFETNTQLIFYDLPGFQIGDCPKHQKEYVKIAFKTLQKEQIDSLLFVVDCNRKIDSQLQRQLTFLQENHSSNLSCFLVFNKMDLCFNRRRLSAVVHNFDGLFNFEKKFFVSADKQFATSDLFKFLEERSIQKDWLYPAELSTPMSEIDIAHEIIKSSIYNRFFKEFPYELNYEIVEFLIQSNSVKVVVKMNCERRIHKYIVVGKNGKNMEMLQSDIQNRLCGFYGREVRLEILVHKGLKMKNEMVAGDREALYDVMNENRSIRDGLDAMKLYK